MGNRLSVTGSRTFVFRGNPPGSLGNGSKPRNYYTEPTAGLRISLCEGSFFFGPIRIIQVRQTPPAPDSYGNRVHWPASKHGEYATLLESDNLALIECNQLLIGCELRRAEN